MAKIGELCLNQGRHKGKQIVSAEWIAEMSTPNAASSNPISADALWVFMVDTRPKAECLFSNWQ